MEETDLINHALEIQLQIEALYKKGILAISPNRIQLNNDLFVILAKGKTLFKIEYEGNIHVWFLQNGVKILSIMSPLDFMMHNL